MLFPLGSLEELTEDGLRELAYQVELELEARQEAEVEANAADTEAL